MGCFRDVTGRRQLQASLAQSDRLSSMGMLAAGVAHEINNPLAYILYNLESLTNDLPRLIDAMKRSYSTLGNTLGQDGQDEVVVDIFTPAMFDDLLDRTKDALDGTYRIRDIARGLGTFSKVERDELSEVNLQYAIECAINLVFNEIKYRARLVKDYGKLPCILASDGRISQVFLNLLINAAHAIDEGNVEQNEIRIRTWADNDDVFAEVSDTGKGIAAEDLHRLFEPFFTTKEVGIGSGLGLAICKSIVTGFGGDIHVQSKLGHGSCFTIRLPIKKEEQTARHRDLVAEKTTTLALRGRILLVDDEAPIRSAVIRMLKMHDVISVNSGKDAQSLLREDQDFDLILCDMMMPKMSGMDLHEWLVTQNKELASRLVFLTGGAFTPKARDYLSKVANTIVEKPFDVEGIRKLVDDLVKTNTRTKVDPAS